MDKQVPEALSQAPAPPRRNVPEALSQALPLQVGLTPSSPSDRAKAFEPCLRFGLTSARPFCNSIPHFLSFVSSSLGRSLGHCLNFWLISWNATEHATRVHLVSSKILTPLPDCFAGLHSATAIIRTITHTPTHPSSSPTWPSIRRSTPSSEFSQSLTYL